MTTYLKYLIAIVFVFNLTIIKGQTFNLGVEYNHLNKGCFIDQTHYGTTSNSNIISGNSMAASGECWKRRWALRLGFYYSVLNLNLHGRDYDSFYFDAYNGINTSEIFYYKSVVRLGGIDLGTSFKILGGNAQKRYSKYFSLMFDLGLNTEGFLGSKTLLDTDTIISTSHTGHYPGSPYPGSSSTQTTIRPATDQLKIIKSVKIYTHLGPRFRVYIAKNFTIDTQFGFRFIKEQYFTINHFFTDKNDFYYGIRIGFRFKPEKKPKRSNKTHTNNARS